MAQVMHGEDEFTSSFKKKRLRILSTALNLDRIPIIGLGGGDICS